MENWLLIFYRHAESRGWMYVARLPKVKKVTPEWIKLFIGLCSDQWLLHLSFFIFQRERHADMRPVAALSRQHILHSEPEVEIS